MIICGDALTELKKLDSDLVQTCVTSPPYWGLRDYGIEGQIGLEDSPEAYVSKLVEIFREVKRVLRDDGTLWLVLGDSYAEGEVGNFSPTSTLNMGRKYRILYSDIIKRNAPPGLKRKDLVGIPWRVAFALQADGWYLRSDIIWSKPNAMPESVQDRPTKAHEYIFLLAKSQRYYYDSEAIAEPLSNSMINHGVLQDKLYKHDSHTRLKGVRSPNRIFSDPESMNRIIKRGRNKRTVWTIPTQPYPEAHFAVFPPALIEPCVLAGSAEKACEVCGAPWKRTVKQVATGRKDYDMPEVGDFDIEIWSGRYGEMVVVGESWDPTCSCPSEGTASSIVLDPFLGSGTTAEVALKHRRDFIGIELNPEYVKLAEKRIRKVQVCLL